MKKKDAKMLIKSFYQQDGDTFEDTLLFVLHEIKVSLDEIQDVMREIVCTIDNSN